MTGRLRWGRLLQLSCALGQAALVDAAVRTARTTHLPTMIAPHHTARQTQRRHQQYHLEIEVCKSQAYLAHCRPPAGR